MSKRETTEAIIDNVLNVTVITSTLVAGMTMPNLMIALEKPLDKYFKKMDKRARARETKRVIYYMREQGLIKGDYQHGLSISKKGQQRLKKIELKKLEVHTPSEWDQTWRMVFYDIPEKHKQGRDALTNRLKSLGFYQLQKSAWIHPFPCRNIVTTITGIYGIEKYTSYIKVLEIDNQKVLIRYFQKKYQQTKF